MIYGPKDQTNRLKKNTIGNLFFWKARTRKHMKHAKHFPRYVFKPRETQTVGKQGIVS